MLARPLQLFVYDIPSTVPHMGLPLERQQQASLFFNFILILPPLFLSAAVHMYFCFLVFSIFF